MSSKLDQESKTYKIISLLLEFGRCWLFDGDGDGDVQGWGWVAGLPGFDGSVDSRRVARVSFFFFGF